MCVGAVMEFKAGSLEKVTEYVTDGFLFAIRIFAPVIVIGAFFFLGGNGITHILGDSYERGILNDWALWLAHHAPLNRYMTALLQLVIGGLTGLDGSGFSGLPLTGALARTFGTATRRFHSGPGMSGTDQCYFYRWRNGSAMGTDTGGSYL